MREILALVSVASMALTFTQQAIAQPIFAHQDWFGIVRDGDPDHGCIALKHVQDDTYLAVYADGNEGFLLGVSDPSLRSQVGDEMFGAITFDADTSILVTGDVVAPGIVLFWRVDGGSEEQGLEPRFRSASQIQISYADNRRIRTDLLGSGRATDLTYGCAEEHVDAATEPTEAPETPTYLSYGSRAGMTVEIVDASGLDTGLAEIRTRHTEANAREFCIDYAQDESRKCIDDTMKEVAAYGMRDRVIGNCQTGDFSDLYGDRYRFEGDNSDPDVMGLYQVRSLEGNEILDGSSASGYPVAVNTFRALCPSQVPEEG